MKGKRLTRPKVLGVEVKKKSGLRRDLVRMGPDTLKSMEKGMCWL